MRSLPGKKFDWRMLMSKQINVLNILIYSVEEQENFKQNPLNHEDLLCNDKTKNIFGM